MSMQTRLARLEHTLAARLVERGCRLCGDWTQLHVVEKTVAQILAGDLASSCPQTIGANTPQCFDDECALFAFPPPECFLTG